MKKKQKSIYGNSFPLYPGDVIYQCISSPSTHRDCNSPKFFKVLFGIMTDEYTGISNKEQL